MSNSKSGVVSSEYISKILQLFNECVCRRSDLLCTFYDMSAGREMVVKTIAPTMKMKTDINSQKYKVHWKFIGSSLEEFYFE